MCIHVFSDDFIPLPVYFVSLNPRYQQEDICRPDGIAKSHEILLILDGIGMLSCEGKNYPLKKGCAFYVKAGTPHEYRNYEGLVTAWVTWRGSAETDLDRYLNGRTFLFFENIEVGKYEALLEEMKREYYSKRREGMLSSMLYTMILSFFDEQKKEELSRIERVLIFMEENYRQKLTLEQLAEQNQSSKATFCKEFRETYGCTAFEKLTEIRLFIAKHLLLTQPELKLSAIADQCGFEDVAYFGKLFRKAYGVSPGRFRLGETVKGIK